MGPSSFPIQHKNMAPRSSTTPQPTPLRQSTWIVTPSRSHPNYVWTSCNSQRRAVVQSSQEVPTNNHSESKAKSISNAGKSVNRNGLQQSARRQKPSLLPSTIPKRQRMLLILFRTQTMKMQRSRNPKQKKSAHWTTSVIILSPLTMLTKPFSALS